MRSEDVEACATAIKALFRREHAAPSSEMREEIGQQVTRAEGDVWRDGVGVKKTKSEPTE